MRRLPSGCAVVLAAALGANGAAILNVSVAHAQAEGFPAPPPPDDDTSVPPPDAEPSAALPDAQTFERSLSPYGRWVDTPEYGRVWVPRDVDSEWQPYTDGEWVDTDWGWSFASYVPWGWAVYHYGSWGFGFGLGWFWVPGFVWAPAWVAWRYYPGYVCWSPLGPVGFAYGRSWPGWVVLDRVHFTHPISRFALPRSGANSIARAASPIRSLPSPRAGTGFAGGYYGRGGSGGAHHGGPSAGGSQGSGGSHSGGHGGGHR